MKLNYIMLGKDQIKTKNGFVSKEQKETFTRDEGNWDLYKMFYEKDGKYGEFYVNLNNVTGVAELVYKNKSYGKDLLKGLREELLG